MARKLLKSKNLRDKSGHSARPAKDAKAKPAPKAAKSAKPAKDVKPAMDKPAKDLKLKDAKKEGAQAPVKAAAGKAAAGKAAAGKPVAGKAAPAAPKKKRSKSGVIRLKAYWGVFNQMMKRVALFEYAERRQADKKAAELSTGSKAPHFVQLVKEVIRDEG